MSKPRVMRVVKALICKIVIREEFGCRRFHAGGITLWVNGYGCIVKSDELTASLGIRKEGGRLAGQSCRPV